jgi:hypothetical protein
MAVDTRAGTHPDLLPTEPAGTPRGRARRSDGIADACRLVARLAAQAAAIPPQALDRRRRGPAGLTRIRYLSIYLAHVELGLPAGEVARAFGRSRKIVARACRMIEDQRDRLPFDRQVSALADAARTRVVRP